MGKAKDTTSTVDAETVTPEDSAIPAQPDAETAPDVVQGDVVQGEIVPAEAANLPAVAGPASDRQELAEMSEASRESMSRLMGWLDANRSAAADPDAAVADILRQIMDSDSVDEVLADVSARALSEWLNKPIRIHGGKFNQSTYEAGLPWYVLLDIEDLETGTRHLVTTGAQSVIGQIVRVVQLDGLPLMCKLVYATKNPTARGYRPVKLAKV